MAIKPLKDRIVALKEEPKTKTASGILLGEAKEAPAYAVVESVGEEVKSVKKATKSSIKNTQPLISKLTAKIILSLMKKMS